MTGQVRRHITRPANVLQIVLGLATVRLGVAVLAGDELSHGLWSWTAPVLLLLLGLALLSAIRSARR
jgi:hypothetical protein